MITETDDRWIVHARGRVLEKVDTAPRRQVLHFIRDLRISFEGDGQLLRGPATDPHRRPADSEGLSLLVGCNLRSLVLFKQGSLRGVFSNGDRLTLAITKVDNIECGQAGSFAFRTASGSVEMTLAEKP